MKKQLILMLTLVLSGFGGWSQSNAQMGVAAMGYVVSDIEKSEKFYTEIVGLIPVGGFSLDEQWSKDAKASEGLPFSVKMFKSANEPTATVLKLAYFEKGVVKKRPAQKSIKSFAGVNYLTFYFEEVDSIAARAKAAGIEIVGWVKREKYQLFFIRDPDGVFVEIIGPPAS